MTPYASSLDGLHAMGERMLNALEADNLDGFFRLFDVRNASLEHLRKKGVLGDEKHRPRQEALAAQHLAIMNRLSAMQEEIGNALRSFDTYKAANKEYQSRPPRTEVLKQHVRG